MRTQNLSTVEPRLPNNLFERHQAVALAGWSCWRLLLRSILFVAIGAAFLDSTSYRVSMHNLKAKLDFILRT